MNHDETAVAALLMNYERALSDADAGAVMKLYADDCVFMPQNSPSSIGADAVRSAYDAVFGFIRLNVRFEIAEIRLTGQDWAFARTNSTGTSTVIATGESNAEANQELFVLQKVNAEWKIARYCFATTKPAR